MSHVYLLVEGQTEEAFVRELLVPHYSELGLYLFPIVANTSPSQKGGVVSYAKIKPQLIRLCRQHAYAHVTTLFDLYALPNDFPGKGSVTYPSAASGLRKAEFLEEKLSADIGEANFIPNFLVHEFEALLFARVASFEEWTDDDSVLEPLRVLGTMTSPEDINDGPSTAPSKRILTVFPDYQKTFHGPLIACDIGLQAIREACPHFNRWLERIESLI
jgi:hypothetical protein